MLIPHVVGASCGQDARGRHRDRPGGAGHADSESAWRVDKFVEFFGAGLDELRPGRPRDDRQYGTRIWRHLRILPDRWKTLDYLALTGRSDTHIALVEDYARGERFWRDDLGA